MRLDSNMLQGPLPVRPPSISFYTISDNTLAGEIPHLICNLSSIAILNLASNNLSGPLPQCLGNLSDSLTIVDVHNNNFHGTIPQIFGEGKELRMIDLSQNQLQGRIPRSLANCTKLEVLNLGNNQIHDIFPFWLGILPELRILILRSNEFFGSMGHSFNSPNLRIIDFSNNDITGKLPHEYFQNWKAMQIVDTVHIEYMEEERAQKSPIGGPIPIPLANLTGLESLDLSQSKLSGVIPPQLTELTFLSHFNVSHNHLTGPIPHGKQFDTFNNNSFSENPELCGSHLSKKCENPEDSPPPSLSHNSKFSFEFSWKVVAMGYGCGFMFGAVFGQIIITKKYVKVNCELLRHLDSSILTPDQEEGPMKANKWVLDLNGCTEEQKVQYTRHLLQGEASIFWDTRRELLIRELDNIAALT
ncbi:receptor like protein 27-like [Carya illinoinensis]|uniref:receptor like protein 27-like n=1 Tax=Carya illinoinensis TaxID=32201 RepID=UPI001C7196F3|nr:receptor like protein 27-like [Carya illinoinensis]